MFFQRKDAVYRFAGLVFLALFWQLCWRAEAAPPRPPNIVLIMVDDLGCLESEGIAFSQCYSGCTVCAPARATLMTGKHMDKAVLRGSTGGIPLPAEEITIPELLEKAGYVTGGFRKWGLVDIGTEGVPEAQGIDLFMGITTKSTPIPSILIILC